MGRWRPPQPKSSPYITREGYERLNEELKYLWKVKRPEVTQAVKEAAAQGDRSENAEVDKEPLTPYYYYLTY